MPHLVASLAAPGGGARALADRRVDDARRDLQGPLSFVDDNQRVVGALSVVGATKMSKCSQQFTFITSYVKFQNNSLKILTLIFLQIFVK